ncbi:alpha-1,2-fucosyltransferase [Agrobacterium sp. SORGH_AS 787]|uniref:alpha-1,2-fucosyltransferase n=1 Tax=Agrobacterium sp. SORGH_AS 787 TaxID=3041775 RepID=UPI0032B75723
MIITRIVGGLGNQMFQYAVGRALSIESRQPLKLDLTEMERYKVHACQLDQLNIIYDVADRREIPHSPRKSVFGKLVNSLKNKGRIPQLFEKTQSFDPNIMNWRRPAHLSGYWQSEKYFARHGDIIRQDFSLKQPCSHLRQGFLSKIRSVETPISVHVRRGDYVTNHRANTIHGTCEPSWYQKAMAMMATKAASPTFFIFSDDPKWAKANLPQYEGAVFVEPQADGKDAEDMHLMAACHSHIIANSTFSWWGAWLNPRDDKRVIAPAQWFRSAEQDSTDIVPSTWERL